MLVKKGYVISLGPELGTVWLDSNLSKHGNFNNNFCVCKYMCICVFNNFDACKYVCVNAIKLVNSCNVFLHL